MYNEGYVDVNFIAEYLVWLRQECYLDRQTPLHLVLDNARYQHCQMVKCTAAELNIVLEFLPGYSPNLNLIERLCRYIKGIIGQRYYETKEEFQKAIIHLLESLGNSKHQANLKKLLTRNFQQFAKS